MRLKGLIRADEQVPERLEITEGAFLGCRACSVCVVEVEVRLPTTCRKLDRGGCFE